MAFGNRLTNTCGPYPGGGILTSTRMMNSLFQGQAHHRSGNQPVAPPRAPHSLQVAGSHYGGNGSCKPSLAGGLLGDQSLG